MQPSLPSTTPPGKLTTQPPLNPGSYEIPYVLPGTYTLTAKANGFKTIVQKNVVLQAGQSSTLDFKLQIGAVAESVSVSATPPLLDAEDAVGNTVLTQRELQNVPMQGRQIYNLIGTTPGSQFLQTQFGASGYSGARGWDVSNNYVLGGGVQGYQQFTLNGSNITQQNNGTGTWELAPNLDALSEVNVQTTNYDARFGRSSGGFVDAVMKSGSNQFHGDLYEYLQNGRLNANNFENNLNGIPVQLVHENQFGGTIGGHIIKDKLFFFGAFEGYVENIPFTTLTSVPPAYLRPQSGQGVNFSQTGYVIYQPNSTFCNGGTSITNCNGTGQSLQRVPFPGNTIPAAQINSLGAAVLNLYPTPNINTGSLFNNFIANVPDQYRYWQPMGRVDYDSSDSTRWYSLFAFQHGTEFRNSSGFPPPAENGNINNMRQELVASQDMTHIFSPTLVVDAKVTFSRFQDQTPNGDLSSSVTPQSIGLNMPQLPTTNRDHPKSIALLSLYQQRIKNKETKTTTLLRQLQQERREALKQAVEEAALLSQLAASKGETLNIARDLPSLTSYPQFDFSTPELTRLILHAQRLAEARKLFQKPLRMAA